MYSQTDDFRRFFLHTLGCKVNQYESQIIRETLKRAGYTECASRELANVYILNTCTVTEHADSQSRRWIRLFRRTNPKAKIVVTGCYVEKNSEELSILPGVSHIVKNSQKDRIADILNSVSSAPQHPTPNTLHPTISSFEGHTKAFVKIQDGCENSCAYCKVPLVRGELKSKSIQDVVNEVNALAVNGYKEIVLVGICLGAWGKDIFPHEIAANAGFNGLGLMDVLRAIVGIGGDFRIRLSSIEPEYVTDELIEFISKNDRICPHIHIPLQSGDDFILKRMNRPYDTAGYKALVDKLRLAIKDVAITTDIMAGFPGEKSENARNSVDFLKMIMPARTHIFTFSKRAGTAAYDMDGEVSEIEARSRYQSLRTASLMASYAYRSKFVGQVLEVLVESKRDKNSGLLTGYSGNYIKILFEGRDELMNRLVSVRVRDLTLMISRGEYCGN